MQGLLPYFISPKDGRFMNNHITFGAMGDSYYEYLLKVCSHCRPVCVCACVRVCVCVRACVLLLLRVLLPTVC